MAQVRFLSVSHADENPCSPLGCLEGKLWVFPVMEVESPAAARGVRMLPLWHKCSVALVALKVEVPLRWKVCLESMGAIHTVACILIFSSLLILLQVPAELQCE